MLDWYALHVRSNSERLVAAALEAAAIENYFPARDRKALFPGYIFGRFDYGRRRPVVTIPQIVRILGIGDQATPIPAEEIEAVRQVAMAPPEIHVEAHHFVSIGDEVTISRGPLAGLRGTIAYTKHGSARVIVSVEMLHRSVSAEIDADCLDIPRRLEPIVLAKAA